MKDYFTKLYRYNAWANHRVLDSLVRQAVADEKILTLMGHILAAEMIWLNRIMGLPPPGLDLWAPATTAELAERAAKSERQWHDFIGQLEDFDRDVSYTNQKNEHYTNPIIWILAHVVNHSSYHRGQIALRLREQGWEAVNTDLITYERLVGV